MSASGSPVVDGRWEVPARFTFARDVVERLAADRARRAIDFADRGAAAEIESVDALPKTRSGKIRRVELRQLEERRAAGGA